MSHGTTCLGCGGTVFIVPSLRDTDKDGIVVPVCPNCLDRLRFRQAELREAIAEVLR